MTTTNCTINGEAYRVADSPVTFHCSLATTDCVDTVQFEGGEAPSGPNCIILSNGYALMGTCIYQLFPVQ